MRGTEKCAADEFVGAENIVQVVLGAHMSALQMAHRVVSHRVTSTPHFLEQFRMTFHILTDHKECRLDAIAVQRVEYPWGNLGNRSVIKGQIDRVVAFVNAPHGLGK